MSKNNKKDIPMEEAAENIEINSEETMETTNSCEKSEGEKSEIQKLEERYNETNDRYLRTLAEYDNYRKRSQKERDAIYPEAKANTIAEFLPIVDNFKRALSFECADTEFKRGMEMIYHSFDDVFKKLGVEEIGTVGELFNPEYHNAVMHIEDEEITDSTVVEVFQQGYRMGDRVLRYAMVKVAN